MDTGPHRSGSARDASLSSRLSLRPSSQEEGHEPRRETILHDEAPGHWILLVAALALATFLLHAWHVATLEPHAAVLPEAGQLQVSPTAPIQD